MEGARYLSQNRHKFRIRQTGPTPLGTVLYGRWELVVCVIAIPILLAYKVPPSFSLVTSDHHLLPPLFPSLPLTVRILPPSPRKCLSFSRSHNGRVGKSVFGELFQLLPFHLDAHAPRSHFTWAWHAVSAYTATPPSAMIDLSFLQLWGLVSFRHCYIASRIIQRAMRSGLWP